MKVSTKWLQSYFEKKLPPAEELVELISVRAFEVEDLEVVGEDFMIDVDVLPNRAHDALSHKGVAKELSLMLERPLLDTPRYSRSENVEESKTEISVDVQESEKCRRYTARVIKNVKIGESPDWLKERLETVGQKSINNVVDATNFVMLDLGQPLHAFDLDKLDGGIVVRNAKEGEQITTLTDEEKTLKDFHLVIADEKDALAIAGVKGGKKAEVDENTKNIAIECANFDPVTTRKTARRLNILTDSSKRFENDLTPEICLEVMERITDLITDIANGGEMKIGPVTDVYSNPQELPDVLITVDAVNKKLGLDLELEEVQDILERFGFEMMLEGENIRVAIPSERLDLNIAEDLIEEIGRIYGYELIPSEIPTFEKTPNVNKEIFYQTKISNILTEIGFSEIYTYSFQNKGEIKMKNPIASDKKFLRTNIADGMRKALEDNLKNKDYLGVDSVAVFEFGHVFVGEQEYTSFAIGWSKGKDKKGQWGEELQTALQAISNELGIVLEGSVEDNVFEANFSKVLESLEAPESYGDLFGDIHNITFKSISNYPVMTRDIAVWVSGAEAREKVEEILKEGGTELMIKEPRLVDTFEKDGRTSLAYRLVFQSSEKTLTDEELTPITDEIYKKLGEEEGFEVR